MPEEPDFFRFSLRLKQQPGLYPDQASAPGRETWLRSALSKEYAFGQREVKYRYVPTIGPNRHLYVTGSIGRSRTQVHNLPPEEGFLPVESTVWRAVRILIDSRHHSDGQKVAIEDISEVGSTSSIISGLVKLSPKNHSGILFRKIQEA